MNQNKEKVLVTGGGGYIGSHAVKKLLKEGNSVVVFDNFSRGWREPFEILKKYGRLEIVEGDVTSIKDLKELFHNKKIDAVMHFAALCSVDESIKKPELYFKNNIEGTRNLLEAMQEAKVNKIIFSSTCAVYGNAEYLPVDEKHPARPLNPYGESKLKAEKIVEEFGELHDLQYVILRYFNVCGADSDGEIGDSKKPSELLVQNAVRGALGIEKFRLMCPTVDTPDGTPIRDYIDVEDLVNAHMRALKYIVEGKTSEIFNLGNGRGWSVGEIIKAVEEELKTKIIVHAGEKRKGEYDKVYADTKKASMMLGWAPRKNLSESIQSLVKWYNNNPNGYEK